MAYSVVQLVTRTLPIALKALLVEITLISLNQARPGLLIYMIPLMYDCLQERIIRIAEKIDRPFVRTTGLTGGKKGRLKHSFCKITQGQVGKWWLVLKQLSFLIGPELRAPGLERVRWELSTPASAFISQGHARWRSAI
jgi:hypothetical protein